LVYPEPVEGYSGVRGSPCRLTTGRAVYSIMG